MTTSDSTPVADRVAARGRTRRFPSADRVELLLEQMTLEEKVGPARQPLGRKRHAGRRGRLRQEPSADGDANHNVAPMQDVFAAGRSLSLEEASRHGLGHLTRVFGSAPVTAAEGAAELVRQQRVVLDDSRLRHPGAGPRGVPDRVHHLRRDGLPGGDRLGGDVRPRPGRADGRRDRAGHGGRRRAPGSLAGAGRRARLPLGPGRGDHGRGSRTSSAMLGAAYVRGLQSAGVIATLKHFAGYSASRAARNHGPGLDGPARAAWTSSCRRSRRPSPWPAPAR